MSGLPRAALLVVWLAPLSAVAGSKETLASCRALTLDAERLACYDRVVDQLLRPLASKVAVPPAPNAVAGAAAPAAAPQEPATPALATFGRSDTASARDLREALGAEEVDQIRSDVTSLAATPDRKLVIRLTNGQTWLQTDTSRISLHPGDGVVVERGVLGAYYLRPARGGRTIAVRLDERAR